MDASQPSDWLCGWVRLWLLHVPSARDPQRALPNLPQLGFARPLFRALTRSFAAASSAAFPAKHRQQQSCKPHAQLLSVAVPRRQTGQAEATHGFRPSPSRESSRALSVPHGDLSLSLPLSREGERERGRERGGGGPPPTSSPCHPLATPDRPPRAGLQPSPAQQQGEKLSETGSAMTAQQQQHSRSGRSIRRTHTYTRTHTRARAHAHARTRTHARR